MSHSPLPQRAYDLFIHADGLFAQGRRTEAIAAYTEGLVFAPEAVYAYVQRGLALQENGHIQEAIRDYDRAIELDSTYGPAYYGRGWARHYLHDFAGELADAQRGLTLDPDRPGMYWRRIGAAYHGLKQHTKSIAMYDRVIELHPDDEGTIYNRALVFQEVGDYQRALADYQRALVLDPGWDRVFINRAQCYVKMKLFDLAAADVAEFLAQHPTSETAKKMLHDIQHEQRQTRGTFFGQFFRRKRD
jgi:tetratricopeptide (TPR) repeat protein